MIRFRPSRYSYAHMNPTEEMLGVSASSLPLSEDKTETEPDLDWVLPALAGTTLFNFLVGPFIVKAFKPEWGYGRRLGATLAVTIPVGAVASMTVLKSDKED